MQSLRISGRVADLSTYDDICQGSRFAQFNTSLSTGRTFLLKGDSDNVQIAHLGDAKTLPTQAAQDAFTQNMLLCNAFSLYPAALVGEIPPHGTTAPAGYALVALAVPNEPAILLSINKDTGELKSIGISGIASYEPAGLKNIDGQHRIYTQWKRIVSDEGATAVMSITAVQLNPQVDPQVFTSSLDAAPPQPQTGIVRFR